MSKRIMTLKARSFIPRAGMNLFATNKQTIQQHWWDDAMMKILSTLTLRSYARKSEIANVSI